LSTLIWRIDQLKRAATAFCGDGSRLYGGRWNSVGNRVVYGASSLSLAAWEVFVHLSIQEEAKRIQYIAIQAEISDTVLSETINIDQLPQNWQSDPAPHPLQEIGDQWLTEAKTAVLVVPSSIIPLENNYLLNPTHPSFKDIHVRVFEPFVFDERAWKTENNSR
jgi:RES domain-containing protein